MPGIVYGGAFAPEGDDEAVIEPAVEAQAEPTPEPAPKPVEADVKPEPVHGKRKRARHPAGAEDAKPGSFVGDDPATPEVNEAYAEE